jgi:hypothetical protein
VKYRLYVDEVGNSDLLSSDLPDHRFLYLTGVIFSLDYVNQILFHEIEKLKKHYFSSHPDDPIILHRKELVHKKPPFSVLKDPIVEKKFNAALLDKLDTWEYTVISVLIDKKEHSQRYSTWKYDPYHYCQEILIERFRLFLKIYKSKGDVLFESRGGKEDTRLKKSFRNIIEHGTHHLSPEDLSDHFTSGELKIKPKTANISGLQVADLIAHPVRRWFFDKCLQIHENEKRNTFSDQIIRILEEKKFFRYSGKILGYGAKLLP